MKFLVECNVCQSEGRRNVLGELKDGCFLVKKSPTPMYGIVRIRGVFEVLCGVCNSSIYFKSEGRTNENTDIGIERILGQGTYAGTIHVA